MNTENLTTMPTFEGSLPDSGIVPRDYIESTDSALSLVAPDAYVGVPHDVDPCAPVVDCAGRECVLAARQYQAQLLCANQIGLPYRVAYVNVKTKARTVHGVICNLAVDPGGDALYKKPTKLVGADVRALIPVYPSVTVRFTNLESGNFEFNAVDPLECFFWFAAEQILNAALELVEHDFATIKNEGEKLSPNAPCFCGSGRKYKKCCARVSP